MRKNIRNHFATCKVAIFCFFLFMAQFSAASDVLTKDMVIDRMRPYSGSHSNGVDTSTLSGKIMCGYQGWFAAEGDAAGYGWVHYFHRADPQQAPRLEECTFDLWPDLSEMTPDEKYLTPFKHQDGSSAFLFSSCNPRTVSRHFQWMQDYGIDGVFLQRFGVSLLSPRSLNHCNLVAANVRAGANEYGRAWSVMYDLSGLSSGQVMGVVAKDWELLVDRMKIREDKAYLHHKGKPVVAVWGIGFRDGRAYSLDECAKLIEFLKNDPHYGGNTVMVGVPTGWLSLNQDAVSDKKLHDIIGMADIVSPWTIGRYNTEEKARAHANRHVAVDITWCNEKGKDYLPVIFPGFSWQNLMRVRGQKRPLDEIPRRGGNFLWAQAVADTKAGAKMLYVAMFDEIDEGTAIFKCSNNPPAGQIKFATYQGLESDHYLWLVGQAGRMLKGLTAVDYSLPTRTRDREPVVSNPAPDASHRESRP